MQPLLAAWDVGHFSGVVSIDYHIVGALHQILSHIEGESIIPARPAKLRAVLQQDIATVTLERCEDTETCNILSPICKHLHVNLEVGGE